MDTTVVDGFLEEVNEQAQGAIADGNLAALDELIKEVEKQGYQKQAVIMKKMRNEWVDSGDAQSEALLEEIWLQSKNTQKSLLMSQ